MASPRLLPSSTSANSDLTRQSCTYSVTNRDPHNDRSSSKFGNTMSMDELITDIYGDDPPPPPPPPDRDFDDRKMSNEITLEEFLFRMGVVGVIEEDVKVPEMLGVGHRLPPQPGEGSSSDSSFWVGNGGGGGGRGKRRAVYTDPADKVAQQRQRRMIKNRESAARSRERKQAYTMELESLVIQLEEENSLLQRERALLNWERYKQLMKNLIPVEEKRKPRSGHVLRRAHSAHW